MSKHTEGEWSLVGSTKVWKTGEDGGAVAIIAEPECRDSSDFHPVTINSKRWDEACANARLIAAAPKMLAALQFVLYNHHEGYGEFEDIVIAAIEAATGEKIPK